MKTLKTINIFFIVLFIIVNNVLSKEPQYMTYITGVGTTHFEAHRMAMNAANAGRMNVRQQLTQKSNDGLWHVILKVSPK